MPKLVMDKKQFSAVVNSIGDYVNAVNPRLEKSAAQAEEFNKLAEELANKLASAKLIEKSDVESVSEEIKKGGMSKIAEAVDFAFSQLVKKAQESKEYSLGKSSSDNNTTDKPLSAEDFWNERYGY